MPQMHCPNCGTRFDRASTDFCPGPDCGFPVDFMEEPEDDGPDEVFLRRPDEPDEPEEPPPPPPPPTSAPPTEPLEPVGRDATVRIADEPPSDEEPPPPPPPPRRPPVWALVAGASILGVIVLGVLVASLLDRDPDAGAEADVADPGEDPPPPEEEPDPGDEPPPPDDEPDPGDDPPADQVIAARVFFVDAGNVQQGQEPFVQAVERTIPHPEVDPGVGRNLLAQLLAGPSEAEADAGLTLVMSGATGFDDLQVTDDGVFLLRLTGGCDRGGLPVTIADQVIPTLMQLRNVDFVKIFDPDGQTLEPEGRSHSIPACLAE